MSTIEEAKSIAATLHESLSPSDVTLLMRVIKRSPKDLYDELLFLKRNPPAKSPLT